MAPGIWMEPRTPMKHIRRATSVVKVFPVPTPEPMMTLAFVSLESMRASDSRRISSCTGLSGLTNSLARLSGCKNASTASRRLRLALRMASARSQVDLSAAIFLAGVSLSAALRRPSEDFGRNLSQNCCRRAERSSPHACTRAKMASSQACGAAAGSASGSASAGAPRRARRSSGTSSSLLAPPPSSEELDEESSPARKSASLPLSSELVLSRLARFAGLDLAGEEAGVASRGLAGEEAGVASRGLAGEEAAGAGALRLLGLLAGTRLTMTSSPPMNSSSACAHSASGKLALKAAYVPAKSSHWLTTSCTFLRNRCSRSSTVGLSAMSEPHTESPGLAPSTMSCLAYSSRLAFL